MVELKRQTVTGPAEGLARREHFVVVLAVLVIVVMAAIYTISGVGMTMTALDMTRMAGPIGTAMQPGANADWTLGYAGLIFAMWWTMMIAMMTPSAAPLLLLYTSLKRIGPECDKAVKFSMLLLFGYLLAWLAFSAVATSSQWAAEYAGVSSGSLMTLKSHEIAGSVLILAGVYQFSALKEACLQHCRSPAQFLADHSRPGAWGAFRIGMHHGAFCLGCCWALMALLFVGGIMNLYWIVGLALYVFAEKMVPNGRLFSRVTGAALIGAGAIVLMQATN